MTRRTKLFAGVGVVSLTAIVSIWFADPFGVWTQRLGKSMVHNALVGQTEEEIRQKYGEPKWEIEGCEPPLGPSWQPPELAEPTGPVSKVPMKTLCFEPRGLFHQRGEYWVWFSLRDGVWVCWMSIWYPDGIQI